MKDTGNKRRNSGNIQSKNPSRTDRRNNKPNQENGGKNLKLKETDSKALKARSDPSSKAGDSNADSELAEVYENVIVHYVGDVKRSEELKEVAILDDASNGTQSFISDNEPVDAGDKFQAENEAALNVKIKEMETRIEKLESELSPGNFPLFCCSGARQLST